MEIISVDGITQKPLSMTPSSSFIMIKEDRLVNTQVSAMALSPLQPGNVMISQETFGATTNLLISVVSKASRSEN